MTRLVLMTFFGEKRWKQPMDDGHDYHPHESPPSMTVPMIVLAVGSVVRRLPALSADLPEWLAPSLGELVEPRARLIGHSVVPFLVVGISALGVLIAWLTVGRHRVPVERPEPVSLPVRAARRDLYANAINEALIARPGTWLTRAWSTSTTAAWTGWSTASPRRSAAAPGGCAGCRPGSSARTR